MDPRLAQAWWKMDSYAITYPKGKQKQLGWNQDGQKDLCGKAAAIGYSSG